MSQAHRIRILHNNSFHDISSLIARALSLRRLPGPCFTRFAKRETFDSSTVAQSILANCWKPPTKSPVPSVELTCIKTKYCASLSSHPKSTLRSQLPTSQSSHILPPRCLLEQAGLNSNGHRRWSPLHKGASHIMRKLARNADMSFRTLHTTSEHMRKHLQTPYNPAQDHVQSRSMPAVPAVSMWSFPRRQPLLRQQRLADLALCPALSPI